jgi:hypothetical protein
MRKTLDSVRMMRQIREDLSARYEARPDLMLKEFREARERFEARLSHEQSASVAEKPGGYETHRTSIRRERGGRG